MIRDIFDVFFFKNVFTNSNDFFLKFANVTWAWAMRHVLAAGMKDEIQINSAIQTWRVLHNELATSARIHYKNTSPKNGKYKKGVENIEI